MSEISSTRRLPPLSPKSVSNDEGLTSETEKPRRRKKKRQPGETGSARERSSSRNRSQTRLDGQDEAIEGDDNKTSFRSPRELDNSDENVPARRKKKKKPVNASRETLVKEEDEPPLSERKKKKKKKPRPAADGASESEPEMNIGLAAELNGLHDDVIVRDPTIKADDPKWADRKGTMSVPVPQVFIEQKDGFKTANRAKVERKRAEQLERYKTAPPVVETQTTIQLGLSTHKVFKGFTVFLQGLFSGIAFWHIVAVFTLSNFGYDILLQYYSGIALPVQSMYYILFALCTVSAFDRYDLGRPSKRFLVRAVSFQSGAICCIFYFIGLIMSLAIASTDDKISLYGKDENIWTDAEARNAELSTWRILNLVRGVFAILGWIVVSVRPTTDRLTKNLLKADENILGETVQMDIPHMNSAA